MKRLSIIMLVAMAMFCQGAKAQKAEMGLFNHVGVGVGIGVLDGVSFEVGAPITGYFSVRGGIAIMPKIEPVVNVDLSGVTDWNTYFIKDNVDMKGKIGYTCGKLLFDIHPFKTGFRITAGAYFGSDIFLTVRNNEEFLKDAYKGNAGVKEGEYKFLSDKEGNMKADVKVQKFRPYVGLGFGRAVPKGRLAFNFDMGVQFWGKPKLWTDIQDELYGSAKRNYVEIKKEKVEDKDFKDGLDVLSKVTVCPVISFRLTGRIF